MCAHAAFESNGDRDNLLEYRSNVAQPCVQIAKGAEQIALAYFHK